MRNNLGENDEIIVERDMLEFDFELNKFNQVECAAD